MSLVIDGSQNIGIHIVHGFAMQQRFCKPHLQLAALAHSFAPAVQNIRRFEIGLGLFFEPRNKFQANVPGEAKNGFGKVFIQVRSAGTANKFASVESSSGNQLEMAFADEDGAGYDSIHRLQECDRSFLKLKSTDIPAQSEIVEAKRLAEPYSAELAINWIGIGECRAFSCNGDAYFLSRDCKGELQLEGIF